MLTSKLLIFLVLNYVEKELKIKLITIGEVGEQQVSQKYFRS
jgi:hypothetical protein